MSTVQWRWARERQRAAAGTRNAQRGHGCDPCREGLKTRDTHVLREAATQRRSRPTANSCATQHNGLARQINTPAQHAMSSLSRLRALQNICATSGVDGLLFVGGVDGKHHAGSREAAAWLLTGLNGRDIFGYNRLDSQLDEAVLLVMPDAVQLYAPPDLWKRLQPLLGNWRRLQVQYAAAAIIDDYEAVEEHKIRSFISIVRGVRLIGVPLPASSPPRARARPSRRGRSSSRLPSRTLRSSPAVASLPRSTRSHAWARRHARVLLQLDPPSLEWLGANEAPRLAACLHECVGTVDATTDGGRPLRASEAELFEPALVYHSHGQLRANNMPNASALPGNTSSIAPHGVKRLGAYIGRRSALLCGASGGLKALPKRWAAG